MGSFSPQEFQNTLKKKNLDYQGDVRYSENLSFSRFRDQPANLLRKDLKIIKKDLKDTQNIQKDDPEI